MFKCGRIEKESYLVEAYFEARHGEESFAHGYQAAEPVNQSAHISPALRVEHIGIDVTANQSNQSTTRYQGSSRADAVRAIRAVRAPQHSQSIVAADDDNVSMSTSADCGLLVERRDGPVLKQPQRFHHRQQAVRLRVKHR